MIEIGTKIVKIIAQNEDGSQSVKYDTEQYHAAAKWCNENGCIIVDKGEYYEVESIPEFAEEEKQKQIKNYLKAVVQNWMDKTVQQREYDGVHTACLYVNSPIEKFQKEGQACLEWMSAVWVKCYAIQDEVLAGTREIPTEEELIAELPVLKW